MSSGANTVESIEGPTSKDDLELKRVLSSTKKKEGLKYNQIGQADQTIDDADEDDMAVSLDVDVEDLGARTDEEKKSGGGPQPDEDAVDDDTDEYDDDIDAELDDLEQSVRGDDDEEEMDDDELTDEDDGKGQPDFGPYDLSSKKRAGGTEPAVGLGAHKSL